ncbi:MAG: PDZ domain-containing protein [Clostridia bacterium]|nr:PDZ domain-containing protein [Clostridia bacterium]
MPTNKGITVKNSSNNALVSGDIVNSVNGIAVHSITDWNEAIKDTYNGYSLKVNYTRNDTSYDVEIQCK